MLHDHLFAGAGLWPMFSRVAALKRLPVKFNLNVLSSNRNEALLAKLGKAGIYGSLITRAGIEKVIN